MVQRPVYRIQRRRPAVGMVIALRFGVRWKVGHGALGPLAALILDIPATFLARSGCRSYSRRHHSVSWIRHYGLQTVCRH